MIERGLYTTKADIGAHFSPHDCCFYTYFFSQIRDSDKNCPFERISTGNSSKGVAVMIIGHCELLARSNVPRDLYKHRFKNASNANDEGLGSMAELLFKDCLEMGLINVPESAYFNKYYHSRGDQYAGRDFSITTKPGTYDVDTKYDGRSGLWALKSKVPHEPNYPTGRLYIETHEGDSMSGDRHRYDQRRSHDHK